MPTDRKPSAPRSWVRSRGFGRSSKNACSTVLIILTKSNTTFGYTKSLSNIRGMLTDCVVEEIKLLRVLIPKKLIFIQNVVQCLCSKKDY